MKKFILFICLFLCGPGYGSEDTTLSVDSVAGKSLRRVHFESTESTQKTAYKIVDDVQKGDMTTLKSIFGDDATLASEQVLLITAAEQTSGIGMNGRVWASPKGNIYATFIFPWPSDKKRLLLYVPQVTNLSVCQTVERFGLNPQLKWINDMLLDGRKSAGILCKNFDAGDRDSLLVTGVGLNVNMDASVAEERFASIDDAMKVPFTSMKMATGTDYSVEEILSQLSQNLISNYQKLLTSGFKDAFLGPINAILAYKGHRVTYQDDAVGGVVPPAVEARFEGVNDDGAAVLRQDDGAEKTVITGRIRLAESAVSGK
jgi:BirA family biotin operon repressor/biotin-[acetyl-CoA-carboxylase] ligase